MNILKNFNDFKDSLSPEKVTQICNKRVKKVAEKEKEIDFKDAGERLVWTQRSQTIGLIFDFLEEYHNWLNE